MSLPSEKQIEALVARGKHWGHIFTPRLAADFLAAACAADPVVPKALADDLKKYAKHHSACPAPSGWACGCGLRELLVAYRQHTGEEG